VQGKLTLLTRSNKGMTLTRPGPDGTSQLIRGVSRTNGPPDWALPDPC
jgi:hypothetical protein